MYTITQDRLRAIDDAVHPDAKTTIEFQRTLRIPDDGRDYPLPAGLGRFPLRYIEDHADALPADWVSRGGVMLPMWRTEALWLNFRPADYPYAVKIAAGKRCAVTGGEFTMELHDDPQDYVVVPSQRWLDGFSVGNDRIRQFVAMPLGAGYTVEEQLSGTAEWGGLQIVTYPLRADRWETILAARAAAATRTLGAARSFSASAPMELGSATRSAALGMAAGGLMRQTIHRDTHGLGAWDTNARRRVFVHLLDSQVWRAVTGQEPTTTPPTVTEYEANGIPWFDLNEAGGGAGGGPDADKIKPVSEIADGKGDVPYADNSSVQPGTVVSIGGPRNAKDGNW